MSVTVTGATDALKLMSASFNGVHQSSPLDAVNTAGGSSGNPSASVTTATANDVVVATLHRHSTTDATTSQTSLYKDRVTSVLGAASYQLATSAGSYTDTYTGSASQNWAMVIAGFKPVTTSGATTTLRFVHPDHLGGTNVVTDEEGLMEQAIDYYPYGSKRIEAGTDVSQREFIGEMFDETPDLSYLNARYYKNARGQFLSQDPVFVNFGLDRRMKALLADPQLQNAYAYSRNNPLIIKDNGGEFANVIIGAGGAVAGQYLYDVYNNVQTGGLSAGAFYSNLSSPETYAVRAVQGAIIGVTEGAAGAFTASVAGHAAIVGGASGVVGAGGNAYLGRPITAQSVVADAVFGGATFGALKFVPGVRGAQPKLGTQKFFGGGHTMRDAQTLVVDTGSNYFSNVVGGASIGVPTGGSGGGAAMPASAFGLSGNSSVTPDNLGAIISFISQFLK